MNKFIILSFFLIVSCGYQPIYVNKNLTEKEYYKITLEGDENINKKIINSLSLKVNEFDNNLNSLSLKTSFEESVTSKNSKGQIESYKSQITLNLIISKKEKNILNKTFIEQFSYSNKDNKFELVNYQEEVKDNLINKIIEDVILHINLK
ncbi:hypothetical protein [Candidatus Pelagibacter communis]|uniref:hypothetical protein n=1 Tax=Pelagibacter ubique TaxID=198252 RepID=UPI00094D9008|nr:hypothetical protein [Candidatus Pelagibacter ubique]|tara:strand:+ start:3549 stop:3998 length:450 start_codon:yes stop_codon:yes gene_type:complete